MNEEIKKETVGKIALDLMQKEPDSRDPIELERAMQEDYMKHLIEKTQEATKKYDNDFYVVVITKNEKLLPNAFRNYFFHRHSCPSPDYDQSVYKYNRQSEQLEYLWTVPSKEACYYLRDNAAKVVDEEKQLLWFVIDFLNGTLLKQSKKLNGEVHDSNILEKGIIQ